MDTAARQFEKKWLAAMIAIGPLPGAPRYDRDDAGIIDRALSDLEIYCDLGVDVLVLENSFDLPYIKPPLPAAALQTMVATAAEIRRRFDGPIGIQVLEAANEAALEIAARAQLDFVRVEGYVFAHVGGAGLIEGCAGQLHRRRVALDCEHIRLFADVKKKHCSHALTADLDIADVARQSDFFLADGIVVTGSRTGEAPDTDELARVRNATRLPVVIGSGMTPDNIGTYWPQADGFIVGSTFRRDGDFFASTERRRVEAFVARWRGLQSGGN